MTKGAFRKNAGIVVFNAAKKVLLCKRINCREALCWQFPQGGIDGDETPLQAAYRELREETGITSVKLAAHLEEPIRYYFPQDVLEKHKKVGHDFLGQDQYWSLFYFTGTDDEINFQTHPKEIEFDAYQWADIVTAPDLVWTPKKEAYKQMAEKFRPIIENWGK